MKSKSEIREILFREADMINKQKQYQGSFNTFCFNEEDNTLFGNDKYYLKYQHATNCCPEGIMIFKLVGGYHL